MARKAFNAQAHSLCLLVIVIVDAAAARGDVVSANASGEAMAQREFDYFALALQWPGSYCQRTRHCCSSSACCQYYLNFLMSTMFFLKRSCRGLLRLCSSSSCVIN
ncbi:hypothetical protein M5K25_001987 [Dendrobium thyrsiflorum]|uniref:Uncharacterized protein n=1 Tax=Dendrobium thyrsiflorum TaxID=117978 RepID=A0ABD0VRX0_DENTH